jgi:hypothetical protein
VIIDSTNIEWRHDRRFHNQLTLPDPKFVSMPGGMGRLVRNRIRWTYRYLRRYMDPGPARFVVWELLFHQHLLVDERHQTTMVSGEGNLNKKETVDA